MITFPVAVLVNGRVECIPYIEKDALFEIRCCYIGMDRKYSGYEIYADLETGKLYACDP